MTDATHLRELYPAPNERAVRKQLDHLDVHCRRFIELSPFLVMASVAAGTDGPLDASPRGGAPGFVKALDATTLLVPDAPGNNRLDSLSNIVATERVGLLFLVPGIDETLRVGGTGKVSVDAELMASMVEFGKPPRAILRIDVREAYFHCGKALMRSKLWAGERVERSVMPSIGEVIHDQTGLGERESQEEIYERYKTQL